MNRILSTTLGYYTPAFFHINISKNHSFEKFSNEDFSVFLHEYIHFIQDVTTIYGLNNMYVQSEYIRYATHKVYKSNNRKFNIPIIPNANNEGNIYLNKAICKLTNGDDLEIKKIQKITHIEIINESTGVSNTPVDSLESVCVNLIDGYGKEQVLIFGAISIMENMAYLLEQMICPEYTHSPDFPYSFAEKIVENIYPEFGKNRLNTLALCDSCLQYSNPGKVFVQFLSEVKSEKWIPKLPECIYDKLLKRKVSLNGQREVSLEENFNELSELVKTQVKDYFNDPLIFEDIRNWVDQLLNTAREIRFSDQYFILDIARGGPLKSNKAFEKTKDQLGTPLISNNSGECTLLYKNKPEGVDVGYFSAIGQIIALFESGNCDCSLYSICTKYGNKVDERCNTNPWERCVDQLLCPYAMLWKHWNLKKFTPTKNN